MFDLLYKDGYVEVIKDETAVARIYPRNDYVLVKMMQDGFDFSVNNQTVALDIIKMRMENEKI